MSTRARAVPRSMCRIACVTLLAFAACDRDAPSAEPSLTLRASGEVVLDEPDSAALGLISGFARTRDGGFLLADRQRGALIRFDAAGGRIGAIGRRGSGPGEWESGPFRIFPFDDSTYAVSDGSVLKVFTLGRPAEAWTRAQSPTTAAFAAGSGAVLSRRIDRTRRSTIARFRGPSDSAEVGGPFPSQLGRSRTVDMMLVFVAATSLAGDTVAVFTQGADHLYIGPFAGPFDSLLVPAVARRGAMPEVLGAVRDDDPDSGLRAAYKASLPFGVFPLEAPGQVALLTLDQDFLGDRMAGVLHVALVNVAERRACGEVRVPVDPDPQPWATVAGDTLFVFSHETDSAALRSRAVVRKFTLVGTNC